LRNAAAVGCRCRGVGCSSCGGWRPGDNVTGFLPKPDPNSTPNECNSSRIDMQPTIGFERTLPGTQPAVRSCQEQVSNSSRRKHTIADCQISTSSPRHLKRSISFVLSLAQLAPSFLSTGRTAAPLPWGTSLSIASRAFCAPPLCFSLHHGLPADGNDGRPASAR